MILDALIALWLTTSGAFLIVAGLTVPIDAPWWTSAILTIWGAIAVALAGALVIRSRQR